MSIDIKRKEYKYLVSFAKRLDSKFEEDNELITWERSVRKAYLNNYAKWIIVISSNMNGKIREAK